MGKLLCSTKKEPSYIPEERLHIDIEEIPDDQILCPICNQIPEILKVHTDNGYVELKCKCHGIFLLTIEEYFEKMKLSNFTYFKTKCSNCDEFQYNKDEKFQYCYKCKKDFCPDCVKLNIESHKKEHFEAYCIPVNHKKNKCLEHEDSEIVSFCNDCQENICDKENKRHEGHERLEFTNFNDDIIKYQKVIEEKNKILSDIINFNKIILKTYNNFNDNYFHIKSLINIGKSFEEENKRDSKEIDLMIQGLEKTHKIQENAIKSLIEIYNLEITGNEEKLDLRPRKNLKLNDADEVLKLISKIQFKRLKEIDLSGNNITNIEPLSNMNLPYLEYLNMSGNKIRGIKPIAELNSKKIKEIFLQNNNIEDFNPLLESDFPELERLRVEKNDVRDLEKFEKLKKKYNRKIIFKELTIEKFNEKYYCNLNFSNDLIDIDLSNLRAGDELIKDLYLMINPNIEIRTLNLYNNDIQDASLLSRFPLKHLKKLDISLNKIKNLKFMADMKSKNLTTIFLNDNQINDLSPLLKINDDEFNETYNLDIKMNEECAIKKNLPNLKVISLKNNYINEKSEITNQVMEYLKNNEIVEDLSLEEEEYI